ncbi:MAG: fused MFS/spermidine synthase [Planctomycetota bacterium]|nr:fused MFS/spermidine synthase [Planctomycetota bacterium]MDP7248129.1 fused MFS/spermidine synthase [Planctomycetota bacterium]
MQSHRTRQFLLLSCFFLSGFCGLVYQIVWVRLIGHVFGNSVYATSTVLGAFMGGLALGSFWGGRVADRREDRVWLYGVLEIGIGIYCIVLPFILSAATPLYAAVYQAAEGTSVWLHLLRAVVCTSILVLPTLSMGATLPLLLRHFVREYEGVGRTVGLVYAINTFGAVAGCVLTGFVLIPSLGINLSVWIAAATNVGIGLLCIFYLETHRKQTGGVEAAQSDESHPATEESQTDETPEEQERFTSLESKAALVAFGISGFVAMVYEVALARSFSLILGSSTYAFSLMLTAFIFGIGLGSIILTRWVRPDKDLILGSAVTQLGIGLSGILMVVLIGELPNWMVKVLSAHRDSFGRLQLVQFVYLFAIMIIPTSLMGLMFPLTTTIWTRRPQSLGRSSGEAYFSNTLGAILGSLAGGFLFLPFLGIQNSILAAGFINFIACALLILSHQRFKAVSKFSFCTGAVVIGLILTFIVPRWDMPRLNSGLYMYTVRSLRPGETPMQVLEREIEVQGKILWSRDGTACTVTVKQEPTGGIILMVNGKIDASTGLDIATQKMAGHVAMMLHPDPKQVLVIGLGSGMTLGSVLHHDPERADLIEISQDVVDAARIYFGEFNNHSVVDPRTKVVIGDGRNHVFLTDRKYDVISSEPSNPWIAGIGNLFTVEFWEKCSELLKDDGIMCQWFQSYQVTPETFQLVLRTFHKVYPESHVWCINAIDFLIVGSKKKLSLDYRDIQKRLEKAGIKADLELIDVASVSDFLSFYVTGPEGIARFTESGNPELLLHTDDNARLEFDMPKQLFRNYMGIVFEMEPNRSPGYTILKDSAEAKQNRKSIEVSQEARWHRGIANRLQKTGHIGETIKRLRQAIEIQKDGGAILDLVTLTHAKAKEASKEGKPEESVILLKVFLSQYENLRELVLNPPERYRERIEALDPLKTAFAEAAFNAGQMQRTLGMKTRDAVIIEDAIEGFRKALEFDPEHQRANTNLGALMIMRGRFVEAIPFLQKSAKLNPQNHGVHYNLGVAQLGANKILVAIASLKESLNINPTFIPAQLRLAEAYTRNMQFEKGISIYEEILEAQPDHKTAGEKLKELRNRKGVDSGNPR